MVAPTALPELKGWLLDHHAATVCADRLDVVEESIAQVVRQETPGCVVEVGCYRGAMSLWMRAVLVARESPHTVIHVFDSFHGMPQRSELDSHHLAEGEFQATPNDVVAAHREHGYPPPVIHPGWICETLDTPAIDPVAFAYLDVDFHAATKLALEVCLPRLSPGAIVVVDDFADLEVNPDAWDGLPGVRRACDDVFGSPGIVRAVMGHGALAFGRYDHPSP